MPQSVTDLTDLGEAAVVVDDRAVGGSPGCQTCGHACEIHDSIASRYCAATASSALSRGCICTVPEPLS